MPEPLNSAKVQLFWSASVARCCLCPDTIPVGVAVWIGDVNGAQRFAHVECVNRTVEAVIAKRDQNRKSEDRDWERVTA